MRRFFPKKIGTQIALLVVAAIVAYHAIFTAFILLGRRPPEDHAAPAVELAIALTRLVAALPADQRAEAASRSAAADPHVRLYVLSHDLPVASSTTGRDEEFLRKKLGSGFQVESAANLFGALSRFTVACRMERASRRKRITRRVRRCRRYRACCSAR